MSTPYSLFNSWFSEAKEKIGKEASTMSVSTIDAAGFPDSRMVYFRELNQNSFCFFTNYNSAKGKHLKQNNKAALLFFWPSLRKQIRIQGLVDFLPAKQSDDYFNQRAYESKITTLYSKQSESLDHYENFREFLNQKEKELQNIEINRPSHWGGYSLQPTTFEFWQSGPHRCHRRLKFTKKLSGWTSEYLYP